MKTLQNRLWAKLLAGFLLIVCVLGLCVSALTCAALSEFGAYSDDGTRLLRSMLSSESLAFSRDMDLARSYYAAYRNHQLDPDAYAPQWEEPYLTAFSPENTNFYFAVYDETGAAVFTGGEGEVVKDGKTDYAASRYLFQQSQRFVEHVNEHQVEKRLTFHSEDALWTYVNEQYAREDTCDFSYTTTKQTGGLIAADVSYTEFDTVTYTLAGYVRETLNARDDLWQEYQLLSWVVSHRVFLIVLTVLLLIASLALFVFLMYAAGHAAGHEGIHLSWFDRIPLDLLIAIYCIPFAFGFQLLDSIFWSTGNLFLRIASGAGIAVCSLSLLIAFAASFAARCKAGTWYRNTVIFYTLRLVWKLLRWLCSGVLWLARNLTLYWKAALIWGALSVLELFFLSVTHNSNAIFAWWLVEKLLLSAALAVAAVNMQKLRQGGERLASGALGSQIDTHHMFWEFRRHAENLNAIADGMQKAVERQTRSERLKTELITNVSHDIKTPLTSIVNYVDLLKKEQIEPERAREYLEVLDRQSARLKKLTEDLVEASKASTGNLACSLEPTDVNVLLNQVLGEYEGRLETGGLEPILTADPSEPKILADGRLLWRVFDNLLSNICKYAMPGTRVYLSSAAENEKVTICFKNISRYALNISADELMERFVRGDSSRSTEGSGLGLSIAQSLTSLQKGQFSLSVDGDLFKASVVFDLLSQSASE